MAYYSVHCTAHTGLHHGPGFSCIFFLFTCYERCVVWLFETCFFLTIVILCTPTSLCSLVTVTWPLCRLAKWHINFKIATLMFKTLKTDLPDYHLTLPSGYVHMLRCFKFHVTTLCPFSCTLVMLGSLYIYLPTYLYITLNWHCNHVSAILS